MKEDDRSGWAERLEKGFRVGLGLDQLEGAKIRWGHGLEKKL